MMRNACLTRAFVALLLLAAGFKSKDKSPGGAAWLDLPLEVRDNSQPGTVAAKTARGEKKR